MIERVRQLNVAVASGVWVLIENGIRSKMTYFAKSGDGRWWSESDQRGVLLFDGHDWWEGRTRFTLSKIEVQGGAGVHHDGLLQSMLSPGSMNIWGESSNPFNTHRPIEYGTTPSGLVQIDFAAMTERKAPFVITADMERGCIVELKSAVTTAAFTSLVMSEPPDWIFSH